MRDTEKRVGHTPGPWRTLKDDGAMTYDIGVTDYDPGSENFRGLVAYLSRTNLIPAEQVEANARLIAAAPSTKDALLNALGWFYADIYDGPECRVPDWVNDAREALADALTGSRDARTRYEAVERALDEWRAE